METMIRDAAISFPFLGDFVITRLQASRFSAESFIFTVL
jgi:hypothetical protein